MELGDISSLWGDISSKIMTVSHVTHLISHGDFCTNNYGCAEG